MMSRTDRSVLAEWWWTVDRVLLSLVLVLFAGGFVMSLSASPSVAETINLPTYHFVYRHAVFAPLAIIAMIALSFLSPRQARRLALLMLAASLVLLVAVLFVGAEVKGSRRWISVAGLSLQPSEFVKPSLIVIVAWLFAERVRRPEVPAGLVATVLLVAVAALLIAEPDLGQTVLVAAVWAAVVFMAGIPLVLVAVLGLVAVGGLVGAYLTIPHVASRIDRFLDPASGDTYQIDAALSAFARGGWIGLGPGEGVSKRFLPDAHTDFVFAVTAEEFGILVCLLIVAAYAALVLRGFHHAKERRSDFERLAAGGLTSLIGTQAFINLGVNLHLLPAKGMTLPFFSYGGSALLATGITAGFLLALTRRSVDQHVTVVPRALAAA